MEPRPGFCGPPGALACLGRPQDWQAGEMAWSVKDFCRIENKVRNQGRMNTDQIRVPLAIT